MELADSIKNIILPTFYHGTDARFVSLPEDIRNKYLEVCKSVINLLFDKFWPYYYPDKEKLKELIPFSNENKKVIADLEEAMLRIRCNVLGLGDYQYNDFYLTSNYLSACLYAKQSYAGGETGLI